MFDISDEVDIHIGTLSKGFGSHGGFVACSHMVKSLLMNKGRSYVFSTALPLPAVAAAQAAITLCHQVSLAIISWGPSAFSLAKPHTLQTPLCARA